MGLFDTFGNKVKGLLGSDAFLQRLAQAQAFAHGDAAAAAQIGQKILDWRAAHPKVAPGALPASPPPAKAMDASGEVHFAGFDPGQVNAMPWTQAEWTPGHPGGVGLRPAPRPYGRGSTGLNPNQEVLWRRYRHGEGEQYSA